MTTRRHISGSGRRRAWDGTSLAAYFKSYAGLFVFHCHTREHQEQSMMRQMQITT
jgi:FtsP/CotA-like multicopper oxidase with cupredoxin domain